MLAGLTLGNYKKITGVWWLLSGLQPCLLLVSIKVLMVLYTV